VTCHTKFHVASGFPEQSVQSKAQQSAKSTGDGLPIRRLTGRETSKTLHQLESRFVDFDGINCPPATQPVAPTSCISGAPLPEGGSSLDHDRYTPAKTTVNNSAQLLMRADLYLFAEPKQT
jgi:hypothetical protein